MIAEILDRIRKNHAIEHATISLLIEEGKAHPPLAGNATPIGFFVYGRVSADDLTDAVARALQRLKAGKADFAISPFCGTNLLVAATLAGIGAAVSLGDKNRIQRIPSAISTALMGLIASQPLGRLLQKHITTNADIGDAEVASVSNLGNVHFVRTQID